MILQETLEEVKKRLVNTYHPHTIYLFGSYAHGNQTNTSDLDLAVIVDKYSSDRHTMLTAGYRALFGLKISKDLFLFTREEFERNSKDATRLSYAIKNQGKIIYAKS